MSDPFYLSFEERFRGSRELVIQRLRAYQNIVEEISSQVQSPTALDIGCGRGEWLTILTSAGFKARGIDLDDSMVSFCQSRGFDVQKADASLYLRELPAQSVHVISLFHVAEHMAFDLLRDVISNARRVLFPGGLLIIETPNCENFYVSTSSFYLDPTHQRPIPPSLLLFLVEYYQFARVKPLWLQSDPAIGRPNHRIVLSDVLRGSSADFGLVAQTSGTDCELEVFEQTYDDGRGGTLDSLLQRYQTQVDQEINRVVEQVHSHREELVKLEVMYSRVFQTYVVQAQELKALKSSISWKLTGPLRMIGSAYQIAASWCGRALRRFGINRACNRISAGDTTRKNTSQNASTVLGIEERRCRRLSPLETTTLFIDVTTIRRKDIGTGIQRVVRSLVYTLITSRPRPISIRLVYSLPDGGYAAADDYRDELLNDISSPQPVINYFREGDIFLGLDLAHHEQLSQAPFFAKLRDAGVKVYFVIYDLLPIQYPEFWPASAKISDIHARWLRLIASLDGALCISDVVRRDFARWLAKNGISTNRSFKLTSFKLGSDFAGVTPNVNDCSRFSRLQAAVNGRYVFLMVGTIEPRKAHQQVLEAFDVIWRTGADFVLLIVGKEGWLTDALISRLRNHPFNGARLFWLEDVDDRELESIYRLATCLIAASHGEGYGLPLIEAARRQLPIIARDIDVFREVTQDGAFFFSAEDGEGLANVIFNWISLFERGAVPDVRSIKFVNWSESGASLLDVLLADSHAERPQIGMSGR